MGTTVQCTRLCLRARKIMADLLIRLLCSAFITLFTKHVDVTILQLMVASRTNVAIVSVWVALWKQNNSQGAEVSLA